MGKLLQEFFWNRGKTVKLCYGELDYNKQKYFFGWSRSFLSAP